MTGLTAAKFGLAGRGQVQPGCYADLTVFDPARIADAASFERPTERAAGIHSVYVNGAPVWREHAFTGRHPGRVLGRARGVTKAAALLRAAAPETGPRDATIRLHAAGLRARPPQT